MKKVTGFSVALALGVLIGFAGTAMAQKKHTPKTVWMAMLAGVNDIQSITGALVVFDMKRAAEIAGMKYTTFWEMARRLDVAPRRKLEQARLEKAS